MILESISSGTPAISIKNNQIEEVLNDKGITINAHDKDLFLNGMKKINNKIIYDKFYDQCLKDRKSYSWSAMSKKIFDIYKYLENK